MPDARSAVFFVFFFQRVVVEVEKERESGKTKGKKATRTRPSRLRREKKKQTRRFSRLGGAKVELSSYKTSHNPRPTRPGERKEENEHTEAASLRSKVFSFRFADASSRDRNEK